MNIRSRKQLITLSIILTFAATYSHAAISVGILDSAKAGPIVNSTDAVADLNNYYDGLTDVTSTLITDEVTDANISAFDLFVITLPDNAFLASEITTLSNFLTAGKHLLIIGEQSGFAATENGYINSLLPSLRSNMLLNSDSVGSGLTNTTSSQIVSSSLTSGVSLLNYGNVNTISGGSSVLLTPALTATWAAFENVSNGRITLLADSNLISNIELSSSNDNGSFFSNIANAAVPEPSSYSLFLGSLVLIFATQRRHK